MANQSQKRIQAQNQQKLNLYLKIQLALCMISIGNLYFYFSLKEFIRLSVVNGYGLVLLTTLNDTTLDLTLTQGLLGLQFDLLYLGWITTILALGVSNCNFIVLTLGFWWTYALVPIFGLAKGIQFYKSLNSNSTQEESKTPIRKTKLTYD